MLRETFVHVRGVGYRTEERLWRAGFRTWDDFATSRRRPPISRRHARAVEDEIRRSSDAFRRRRHSYFARVLPTRDRWRAWRDFRRDAVYLDIETTGLSLGRNAITVVGVYDGNRRKSFVQGENLEEFPAAVEGTKLLVTFNGARFDLPFLRKAFPRLGLNAIHLDMLYPLQQLGFFGGLKTIEVELGISRTEETAGLRGSDAIRLWRAYETGNEEALDLLLEYNMEDAVNLEPLAGFAYEGLRRLHLDRGFVSGDQYATHGG